MPKQIHTDNGSPFGAITSVQRFSKLSFWFIDLGITSVLGIQPTLNKTEDMRECTAYSVLPPAKPSANDMKSQQSKSKCFCEKNHINVRPHEALNMEIVLAGLVHTRQKPIPESDKRYRYPEHMKVMNVTKNVDL